MDFTKIATDSLLGRSLRWLLRGIPRGLIVPVLHGPLRGYRWIVGSSVHGCWIGTYEEVKQHIFAQTIRQGFTVYDIGANVGFYTLLAARFVGRHGKVFAFEPVPSNLNYLRRHVLLNDLKNVEICEVAVGNKHGRVRFDLSQNSSSGRISELGELEVDCACLDDMIETRQLVAPDLVKIDVEGGEHDVLLGAKRLLKRYRPMMFLATHGAEIHDQCISLLVGMGYSVRSVDGQTVGKSDELMAVYTG